MPPSTRSPLPTLLLTEAVLKLLGGAIFFLSPTSVLKNLASQPYSPASLSLIRSLGTQTIAFSVPLFLSARSDAKSVGSRRIVYWGLLAREGVLALGYVLLSLSTNLYNPVSWA
ncbi:hypothetical protein BU26DRAFT_563193 [Trematosphaeria pertusa]|uniref:Uncharacterized protein n=1 Tax=Trematosphaeria pertusa TaxID=390896 RepID=A0A6A6ILE3_9PLEO|nr:uncharacterized protein BU26DRAFT_563193 [Trematosphaeria pertusa]KAF2251251.1 hypothetical protein BU26DRAFT_563193 [Trematosphaeria pertusa]